MKKSLLVLCLVFVSQFIFAQANSSLSSYADEMLYTPDQRLSYLRINKQRHIRESALEQFINSVVFNDGINKAAVQKTESDELGFTHIKFSILQNGIPLANKVIIAHCKEGRLISLNGDLDSPAAAENNFSISEKAALGFALTKVNAKKYKWDNLAEEQHMREALNEPDFTYQPHGEKMVFEKEGKFYNVYRFNIYAEEPLYRAHVFVEAATGKILDEQSLICTANVPASADTKYSGTQTITADYNGSLYRFRENQRGLGVETYNMKNTTIYSSTDFTNTTASWTTTGFDQGAADAHWGAEKTYDYFFTEHNRNSINNNGYKLLSYVHYQTNYANAFWDGQRMTYGDGNGGSYKIFTALDVCGHEITHGLTSNTGNLIYSYESGALNESYSDIFGVAIENYARPNNWNWKIGEDITSNNFGLRNMATPNQYSDPDTYGGLYYYNGAADNGGVHINSGVSNFWFYLLTTGGSGTNDLNNAYSVSAIGMTNAAKIAFRALTVYYTPTTNYANARLLTIQAAKDLFGDCSNEVIQTTRAWYAVGVGANYVNGFIGPNFNSNITSFCSAPANVSFTNTTVNGLTYTWNFGDGNSSTSVNPIHTYNAPGTYAVKLKAVGCANVTDSVTKTSFIVVNPPLTPPSVSGITTCENTPVVLNGSAGATIKWYDGPSSVIEIGAGSPFTAQGFSATTTLYAANTVTQAAVTGGMPSNTGGGYLNSNANWLNFNVIQPGVLNSVVVYAQTIGNRVIQLRNAANAVIHSATVNLSIGTNTVTLNFPLTTGNNYRLGLSNTSASSLYRSNNGVNYPYNVGGCVSITSSNVSSSTYYYFYNWKVTVKECASPRVPVTISVIPLPQVAMSVPFGEICNTDVINMQGTPPGGSYTGNSMNGSLFNAGAGAGTYSVTYTYTDENGCSNTSEASIMVAECTGLSEFEKKNKNLLVYPNPASSQMTLSGKLTTNKITVTDALGRLVFEKVAASDVEEIDVRSFTHGLYMISVTDQYGVLLQTSKWIKE